MKSIRMKITFAIVFCSLISAIIISLLSVSNSRSLSNTDAQKELTLNCSNACKEMNSLISRIEQSVDTLSDIALSQLDFSNFKSDKNYVSTYTQNLTNNFYKFSEHTDGSICSYIRYNPDFTEPTSGIFLTRPDTQSSFDSMTPTDFSMYDKEDLAHVGWYYIPVANKKPLWMDPYMNENINVYMISYVVPLYVNGTSVGILGMDIDFRQITDIADSISIFDNGYSFIAGSDGTILHHREIPSGTALSEYNNGELSIVDDFISDSANLGTTLEYNYNGIDKCLSFSELDNGMKLVLCVPVNEIKANANLLSGKIFSFLIIGIIISIVLGFIISNTIANPIKQITEVIKQTSQLNFHKTERIERLMKLKDETGIMAKAVYEMRSVLRDIVTDIRSLSEQEQKSSLDIMTRARKLRDSTSSSTDKAMEIYESMKVRTNEAIEQSKVVSKINELTDNIREISSQTNLLALNANIEAARAGEAGKGFAVVATEIGALSNQTFNTVDSINEIVYEVNAAVTNMTECIQVIMHFLEETVVNDYSSFSAIGERYEEDAQTFNISMQHIYSEISDLNDKINNIANTIGSVNETISESTEGISFIAEKSADAVNKTLEGCNHLRESESNLNLLKSLIERFEI